MLHKLLFSSGGLLLCASLTMAQPPSPIVRVIFPDADRVAVSSAHHYLIGTADTLRADRVEISHFLEKSEEMEVNPASIRQDFARLVKRLFGPDFQITHIECRSRYAPGTQEEKTVSADFLRQNRVGLRTFWESKEFQKIYTAVVRDTSATHINVLLQGYKVTSLDLRSPGHSEKFGNFFIFRLTLNPGSNDIMLRALDSKGRILRELPFVYIFKSAIDKKTEVPTSFAKIKFHTRANEAQCAECHRMRLQGTELSSRAAVAKMCYPCHKWITEAKFLHGPISTWNCLFCHRPPTADTSGFDVAVDSTVAVLCYECHKRLRQAHHTKPYIHGPVSSGACNLCHSPHGSNYPGQIWMPALQLCVTCHGERYMTDHPVVGHPIRGVPDPLNPDRELSCISCHDPHNSDSPNLFYTATGLYQLCQECHRK